LNLIKTEGVTFSHCVPMRGAALSVAHVLVWLAS
jgi:hypothetical protein